MNLIQLAPELHEKVNNFINTLTVRGDKITVDSILDSYVFEHGIVNYGGLAAIMCEVIKETEGIELLVCDDFEGETYLIYSPNYPWNIPEKERSLTKESLSDIYIKYLSVITDEPPIIDFHSVANGA